MLYYKDYFGISEDYASCMTREAINRDPRTWMQFYPHETFVSLLRDILESMDGGDKSIWLTGAYGTGKSHAALVLQKLFMDDENRVKEWLLRRSALIPHPIGEALMKQRHNGVLAVFETKSDHLTTPEQFLVRIENGIIKALKDGGYKIPALGSLEKILERIREEEANFFKKRDEIQYKLSNLTPDITSVDILTKEIAKPELQSALLSDVMTVLHARDIYINLSSANLIQWINDILRENNLSRMLFIWDEFSSYIDQNRSQLKTFEEIAEAAQEGKFFFIPVTHMKLESYLAAGSDSAKKANGRFKFNDLDIPTNTALLLAADAFKVIDPSWDAERAKLWHDISPVVNNHMVLKDNECKANPECFEGILPIHPMTAFVLKFLSRAVGSNQRSMFNFLKGEVGESEFQTFISNSGPEVRGRLFLTVDHLWHYFVERSELGTGKEVNDIRVAFDSRVKNLDAVEQRVFKAVLLYSLLGRLTGNAGHELIQPTLENVKRCFEGDGEVIGVEAIAKELEKKHCFSIINGRCEMFRETSSSEDLDKQKTRLNGQFQEQLVNPKIQVRLESKVKTFKDKLHFEVRAASVDKVMSICQSKKEQFGEFGNKILLQFIIAKNGEEQLRIPEKAKELATQWRGFRMIFVTFPELHFCTAKLNFWDEYVEQLAHYELANDQITKTNYGTQIKLMDDAWLAKLMNQTQLLRVYKPNANGEPYIEDRLWGTLEGYLKQYLKESFECFVDDLSDYNLSAMSDMGKGIAAWAKTGIDFSVGIGASQSVCKAFGKRGITDSPEWFEQNPTHPLTQMRNFCKNKLENAIYGSTGSCSIRKIYIDLQRAPYALLSIPYSAFVMGFVMKEWVNNPRQQLQWTNGALSDRLDNETLAEMIEAVIKDDGNNAIKNEKLICRISKEEKKFIEFAPVMFGTQRIPNATVEGTLGAIAARLERVSNKAPLWVLPPYIYEQEDLQADNCKKIIDNLCAAQKISAKGNQQERTACIKEIGRILQETEGLAEQFSKYITPEIFETAFRMYVDSIKPELSTLASIAGDVSKAYCSVIKNHFANTASWLWNEQNVEDELELVEAQYKIIAIVQELIGAKAFLSYEDAMNRVKKAIFTDNKISIELLSGNYPFLTRLIQVMDSAKIADGFKELSELFAQQKDELKKIFFDQAKTIQLQTLKVRFDTQISSLSEAEMKDLYGRLSEGAKRTADEFIKFAAKEIDEYLKNSMVQQMLSLWQEKTQSSSPNEWSKAHNIPSYVLFAEEKDSKLIVLALNNPNAYQAEILKKVKNQLANMELQKQELWEQNFLKLVLPNKYIKLNPDVEELCNFFKTHLGNSPDEWIEKQVALHETAERYIREHYAASYKIRAVDKVKAMSEAEAKKMLLKFVENNPDVGIGILE